jgi:urease subunit gamma/beta
LVDEVRLEVLMGDGTRLIVLHNPLGAPQGTDFEVRPEIPAAPDRERRALRVTNNSRHAIRVSSRFPFERVNSRMSFDRAAATGFHLDIQLGSTVRWAPGETREVTLIRRRG